MLGTSPLILYLVIPNKAMKTKKNRPCKSYRESNIEKFENGKLVVRIWIQFFLRNLSNLVDHKFAVETYLSNVLIVDHFVGERCDDCDTMSA